MAEKYRTSEWESLEIFHLWQNYLMTSRRINIAETYIEYNSSVLFNNTRLNFRSCLGEYVYIRINRQYDTNGRILVLESYMANTLKFFRNEIISNSSEYTKNSNPIFNLPGETSRLKNMLKEHVTGN